MVAGGIVCMVACLVLGKMVCYWVVAEVPD